MDKNEYFYFIHISPKPVKLKAKSAEFIQNVAALSGLETSSQDSNFSFCLMVEGKWRGDEFVYCCVLTIACMETGITQSMSKIYSADEKLEMLGFLGLPSENFELNKYHAFCARCRPEVYQQYFNIWKSQLVATLS